MNDDLVPHPAYAYTMERLESLKKTTNSGREYWSARDILTVLGYVEWRNFEGVIGRAIAACEGNKLDPKKHFVETTKMMGRGQGAQHGGVDYFLSRPACYLIAMNGDPTKPEIAAAQAYFAVQTRRMELQDRTSEDEKRLELREKVKGSVKRVSSAAKEAGVRAKMQGVFHEQRYRGLYDASSASVKRAKGLKPGDNLLDYAGPLELSANDFQMNLAADVLQKEHIRGEQAAIDTNLEIARDVRNTIRRRGGTLPEQIPLQEPISEVRKRLGERVSRRVPKTARTPKPPKPS